MNQLFDTSGLEGAQKKRLFNAIIVAVVLLAVFLAVKAVSAIKEYSYIGGGVYPSKTITVSGMGEVFSIPDTASFYFSVNEKAKTVKEAQDKASTKMNSIIEALKGMGVEEKDIKTTGYNSGPRYEWRQADCSISPTGMVSFCPSGKNVLVGYEVSQTITVKIRNTEEAGKALTKVGELGAENISGLSFVVDDMDAVKAEAREKAITDAKEKAKALSKSLGVKFGKIVSFYDSNDYPPVYYGAMEAKGMGGDMMSSSVTPELPVGENKTVSNVSITYEVK